MTADAYDDALEVLLVQLARKSKCDPRAGREEVRMKRFALRGSASLAFALALFAPRSMAAQDDGHDLLRGGKYQQAIAALNKVPASDSDWAASQRDLVRAYATIGKYDEAEAAARRAVLSPKGRASLESARRSADRRGASARRPRARSSARGRRRTASSPPSISPCCTSIAASATAR